MIEQLNNEQLIVAIRAAIQRLEQRPPDPEAFMRGFRSGALSAYRDILRQIGEEPTQGVNDANLE